MHIATARAAVKAKADSLRPYDLQHAFVTLSLHASAQFSGTFKTRSWTRRPANDETQRPGTSQSRQTRDLRRRGVGDVAGLLPLVTGEESRSLQSLPRAMGRG